MKKKTLPLTLLLVAALSAAPVSQVAASEISSRETQNYKCNPEDDILNITEPEPNPAGELLKDDICIAPAKKTLRVGKSFSISIKADNKSEYAWLSPEEFNEILCENIDSITYRSANSSIASVNKYTGKVTGRRQGYTVIRTYVNLSCGESAIFKTKVYVTNR